ncbi:exodeoxyribonuclease VII large subunit [Lawsonella clevelandensis]|jgi:exodeoxyribonuclease VII, large subunit|uniref:exodeoxyribonuclease VII large subunit n=2 Tax=Lawsonella TaxID=1847725 RepID=UPI00359C35B3
MSQQSSAVSGGKPQAMSADHPYPVREVSALVASWINRLGEAWVEGEITQLKLRRQSYYSYFSLRDLAETVSLQVTCPSRLLAEGTITEGTRVIVHGNFALYKGNGSLSLLAKDIRQAGLGELLARLERLRQQLAAEGLFDTELKRPLPYLPRNIGLITGRNSAAERDVLSVAHSRWPEAHFTVRYATVQGARCVPEVVEQLRLLDADPSVDVIIIARGGGSMEDLLPFSDETLVRAVSRATTPVVSAIGHEPDIPLLDYVADLRAATPTDAAKKVVPDVVSERSHIRDLRARNAQALRQWVRRESALVESFTSRPVMASPVTLIEQRLQETERAREELYRQMTLFLANEDNRIATATTQLTALGPIHTLARGYSIVQIQHPDGTTVVLNSIKDASPGSQLRVRATDGVVNAAVLGTQPCPSSSSSKAQVR